MIATAAMNSADLFDSDEIVEEEEVKVHTQEGDGLTAQEPVLIAVTDLGQ